MFESALQVDPSEVFADLVAVIDALPARAVRGGTAVQCDARIRSLMVLSTRLQALLLSEVAAFDDQGFAASLGARSTGSYLAAHAHLDPAQARRMVVAARTADRLPRLGAMLSAGDITVEHVAAVGFATRRVPSEVLASQDATFATLAGSSKPSDLRVAGTLLQSLYDTDAASRDSNHVRDSRYLTLSQTFEGAWHVQGLLTPEDGVALSLVLDSLSGKAGAQDDRTPTQRRADALVEMATLTLRAGELPDTGGDQPRVTLLLQTTHHPFAHHAHEHDSGEHDDTDLDDGDHVGQDDGAELLPLAGGGLNPGKHLAGKVPHQRRPTAPRSFNVTGFNLADAQLLGAATMMSPETLQRICCDAQFNLATHDSTGNLLNLGRSTRDPNLAQKRAIKLRDKHCVFPGCDHPPNRCQVHHLHYWGHGGPTDLHNLALICHYHHHLIHENHWTLTTDPPTPPTTPPAAGKPPHPTATSSDNAKNTSPDPIVSGHGARQLTSERSPALRMNNWPACRW